MDNTAMDIEETARLNRYARRERESELPKSAGGRVMRNLLMILLASTGAFCHSYGIIAQSPASASQAEAKKNFHAYLERRTGSGGFSEYPGLATGVGERAYNRKWSDDSPAGPRSSQPTSSREPGRPKENRSLPRCHRPSNSTTTSISIFCKLPKKVYSTAMIPCRSARSCPEASGFRSARWVAFHKALQKLSRACPIRTVSDYEDILARLEALPKHFDQNISASPGWAEHGYSHPKIILRDVPNKSLTSLPPILRRARSSRLSVTFQTPFRNPNAHASSSAPKRFTPRRFFPP